MPEHEAGDGVEVVVVELELPNCSLKSSIVNDPSIRIRVSSSRSTDSSGRSNSSSMSPTISSSRSSSVTMPGRRAVLVDDDRHVLVRLAELREEGAEVLRLRDDVRRMEQRLESRPRRAVVFERGDERPDVEDPEHVVERLAVDRVAGVRRVEDEPERLLGGELDRRAPTTSGRGTITSAASFSAKSKTL